jgi:hypothetical protein
MPATRAVGTASRLGSVTVCVRPGPVSCCARSCVTPAARVELPGLARLMGQRVVSIEALDEHGYAEWSVWAKKVVTL